jgi:hypothetical protein
MMNFHSNKNREAGVTLLLAVILVSAIALITSTIAAFVIQEIRSSRSSALTEPAIIAAESAGEQGLYEIKQGGVIQNCDSPTYTQIDGTANSSATRIMKCITSSPAIFQIDSATPLTFYLYDSANVNGNTCMESGNCDAQSGVGDGNQLYTSLKLNYLTGGNQIDVEIVTLDGISINAFPLASAGNSDTYPIPRDILGSSDERLMVTLTPSGGTSTVEVSTTRSNGTVTGIPDYETLDATGCQSLNTITDCDTDTETFKRRINITLPK